jgi:hypothetical protein
MVDTGIDRLQDQLHTRSAGAFDRLQEHLDEPLQVLRPLRAGKADPGAEDDPRRAQQPGVLHAATRLWRGIDVLVERAPHLDRVEASGGRGADPVSGVRAGLGEQQLDVRGQLVGVSPALARRGRRR